MPLDPPAHSTPPTAPAPSTPPPESPSETVWRRTFLAQFANPADREALERFGDLLYTVTLGAGYLGDRKRLFAADELDAVADEIDELAATVKEISEVPDQCEVGEGNLDLCREARDWEGRLGDLAHEIRCRVREVEGGPDPEPVPAPERVSARVPEPISDRPLGDDVRDADRMARRLADHHPGPRGAADLPAARGPRRGEAEGGLVTLFAVLDADGFVLATWESPFEPQQPRTRQRGDRLVKKTPNATGWVVVEGTCRRGDRLAVDEHGCGRLAMEGNAQTYSPFFFKLEDFAAEAEDLNYHALARVLDQVRLLFSVGEIGTVERLLQEPADRVRQAIRPAKD